MTFIFNTKDLKTIHKQFILKPNPYISNQQAQKIYFKYLTGEMLAISSVLCFSLSLMKIIPRISLNVGFKKFTVFQMFSAFGFGAWYIYDLNQIKANIPKEELYVRQR